jgi:hypothetical protein
MTVYVYTIVREGVVDKIGVASTPAIAQRKVREQLGWVREEATKPWDQLLFDAGESNIGISIDAFEVNGKPMEVENN